MCEEGEYVRDGSELICGECSHTPQHSSSRRSSDANPWERFWTERQNYSGHYGPERKKCVGGFASAY